MAADRCDCPSNTRRRMPLREPTPQFRDPTRLAGYTECGCCMADCPDVHPAPAGINIVPGTAVVSVEHFATLTGYPGAPKAAGPLSRA